MFNGTVCINQVLHKYLDNAEVSFIGITNHILDAAKTNRAVTLCRPRADEEVRLFDSLSDFPKDVFFFGK